MTDAKTDYAAADDVGEGERQALEALLFRLADDEYVVAERYIEWQIYAPSLESDLALANIAQDEFGHARLWYDLLQEFGRSEEEVLWERDSADFRHSTLVELPFEDGDWADVVVRSYLYDTAERLRLEALANSSYAPIRDRVGKVLSEERYHREHAGNWLERLARKGEHGDETSHRKLEAATERLLPHALSLFEAGPHEADIVEYGFRTRTLEDLREEWLDIVVSFMEGLDLAVPDPDEVERPEEIGRDGSHTDDWFDLYDDFTHTYRELDFEEPIKLRAQGPKEKGAAK
ncbi:1,2-phenylacetyl-CoA epoxidase subunit PaaC [Halobium salinum]|uniref:1,2-phenylacetyl-CoA epoxidase subunit PaaC n=1 Tax=Halobium salinum TaxID=1364940 RepID=A0ABD5PDL4_9EURY|nr:1,2-phenylacetyl-CoA epoxidase subunit PaaC [Halobium salinum]